MRKLLLFCFLLIGGFSAGAQCVASFSYAAAPTGNSLLNVAFTNNSNYGLPFSGQLKTYFIYYGDGNTNAGTTSSIAPHNYPSPGTYLVRFLIYSIDSATSSQICKDSTAGYVTIGYNACGSIIGISGTGANRNFTSVVPGSSTGVTYAWSFGDGGTSTSQNPSHTYTTGGYYTITLVTTVGSCVYTNTIGTYISIPPPALVCGTLHATFTSSVAYNVATFTNTSTTIASSQYYSVATWDYGDGGTAAGFSPPPHTYSAPGIYTVKLRMQWRDSTLTTSCKDSITHSVTITSVPVPSNLISGSVIYDTTLGTNYFQIWLIQFDSASNSLIAIDSQITASISIPYYAFSNYPAGQYRIKAAVYLGSTSGNGMVPTYHDSSAYWGTASVINHHGAATLNQNVYMRSGTVGAGPGFIGGNVSLGANKGTSSGVSNQLVFLRNATTKIVRITYTDSNGNYSFSNLALGAYSIYPELINYSTIPVTPIVLTTANPTSAAVNFNKDDAKRSIAPRGTTGVPGCNCDDQVLVYPNPAHTSVTISWNGHLDVSNQFVITTITGNVVATSPVIKGTQGSIKMDIGNLAHGLYFIHGTNALSSNLSKLIVQ